MPKALILLLLLTSFLSYGQEVVVDFQYFQLDTTGNQKSQLFKNLKSRPKLFGINKGGRTGYKILNDISSRPILDSDVGIINRWDLFENDKNIVLLNTSMRDSFDTLINSFHVLNAQGQNKEGYTFSNPNVDGYGISQNKKEAWLQYRERLGSSSSIRLYSTEKQETLAFDSTFVYQIEERTFVTKELDTKELYELKNDQLEFIADSVTRIKLFDNCFCFARGLWEHVQTNSTSTCITKDTSFNFETDYLRDAGLFQDRYLMYPKKKDDQFELFVRDIFNNGKLIFSPTNKFFVRSVGDFIIFRKGDNREFEVVRNGELYDSFEIEKPSVGMFTEENYFNAVFSAGNLLIFRYNTRFSFVKHKYATYNLKTKEVNSVIIPENAFISFKNEVDHLYVWSDNVNKGTLSWWNDKQGRFESLETVKAFELNLDPTFVSLLKTEGTYTHFYNDEGFDVKAILMKGTPYYVENKLCRTSLLTQTDDETNSIILTQYLSSGKKKIVSKVARRNGMIVNEIFFENGEAFAYIFTKEAGWQVWKLGDYEIEPLPKSLVILASDESDEEFEIQVYPNPTSDFVRLTSQEPSAVFVSNTKGQKMGVYSLKKKHKIDFSTFKAGTYILKAVMGDKVISKKVIKY